jgi:hypothetical protein
VADSACLRVARVLPPARAVKLASGPNDHKNRITTGIRRQRVRHRGSLAETRLTRRCPNARARLGGAGPQAVTVKYVLDPFEAAKNHLPARSTTVREPCALPTAADSAIAAFETCPSSNPADLEWSSIVSV